MQVPAFGLNRFDFSTPDRFAADVAYAESLGWDYAFVPDSQLRRHDTYVLLGFAAKATSRIRLGTLVSAVGFLHSTTAGIVLIVFFALVTIGLGLRGPGQGEGFGDEVFNALLHALDPGTVAGDVGHPWRYILTMLALTVGGLFIVSALIGVIAAGIDAKIAELQRGRSLVLERDHTVILGWSESIFTILRELAIANESRRRPVVVVLADRDKVEMEEEIRAKVPDTRGTRIVCRSGSPMDVDDLAVASHRSARSVILQIGRAHV